ncbi:Putative restriction endonuclease [Saccharopolyspora kobensis]|uniref:Restriction endonuclease n=1 Tax=Saccharopolyspora kobensis TaxID=146035 RepID=A0A1H6E6P2_9PSEU|nr:Putative restriction endonuclease [Saccharopolyspora kobensis]SFD41410.1 Putative restriction endonuclease [Saccharopolyspora kobensis]
MLAIEVVSESSFFRDYNTKAREQADFGIPAYWVVNPLLEAARMLELRLDGGDYRVVQDAVGENAFTTEFPFQVTIIPDLLMAGADGPWDLSGEGA